MVMRVVMSGNESGDESGCESGNERADECGCEIESDCELPKAFDRPSQGLL